MGTNYQYEAMQLDYVTKHTYTPDFVDYANKTIIESKGFFRAQDRAKMLAVKAQNPEWRIIFIFQNPDKTISKTSKTTYKQWAIKNGFEVKSVDDDLSKC